MSKILVDTIDTRSGTSNITIGSSNASQITLKSGATLTNFPSNTPAFLAYIDGGSSGQTISNNTGTMVLFDQEVFDTDGKFNTSDGKFTPTVVGKYFIFGQIRLETDVNFNDFEVAIYKNGSTLLARYQGVYGHYDTGYTSTIADLDADDYVQVRVYQGSGSNKEVSGYQWLSFMGGYKLIGA